MALAFGKSHLPSPDDRRNDDDHVYGDGWIARRTPDGIILSWDAGGIQTEVVGVRITEEEFDSLRSDPRTFQQIYLRHDPNSVPLRTIGDASTITELLDMYDDFPPPSIEHVDVCRGLWEHTRKNFWRRDIEQDLLTNDKHVFTEALEVLAEITDGEDATRLRGSLAGVLLESGDPEIRRAAVDALLRGLSTPSSSEIQQPEHRDLQRRMLAAIADDINALLDEAEALSPNRLSSLPAGDERPRRPGRRR